MKFKGKTIFKQKNSNSWYTRYRHNGKQHFISGKTQKEVLNKLKLALNYKPIKKNVITLYTWYLKWLELFKKGKVKETTIKDYEKSLKYINEKLKNKDLTQITSIEIINNLDKIKLERTKQKVYELLYSLFEKAKDFELIQKNVLKVIEKPKHIREKGIALTEKEQEKFIEICNSYKYGDLFLITLYQGLRIGETLAITGNDIDIINKTITINKSINKNNDYDTTKNQQSNRIIPIFDKTLQILLKYKEYKSNRLFNITYNVPQKHLKKIITIANIRNISSHDLRHTFITNCKNKNIPEHIIQSWVGHTIGSKVTNEIYTHVNFEDTHKFIEKMN